MYTKYFATGAGILSLTVAAPTPTVDKASRTVAKSYDSKASFGRNLRAITRRDSSAVVTGAAAVSTVNDQDGIGGGSNTRVSYSGDGSSGAGWPSMDQWVSFEDMFNNNENDMFIGCGNLANPQPNDSDDEVNNILASIEAIAAQSFVDHRFILAVIMQESNGCVRVPTTNNGISNPGLMQDFQGFYTCNDNTNIEGNGDVVQDPCPSNYIEGMIREGAVGTDTGDGLATDVNTAQTDGAADAQVFYRAARYYNSGSVCGDDLSDGCGATASYASDIANRLTGWLGN